MTMIAPSNTSPSLTSDLAGTPGANNNVGYYRTSHNALLEGEAVAQFVLDQGITTAAAIHDGDPYTHGLATAFENAYERGGGTVTSFVGVHKEDSDMVPVLTTIAAHEPGALFYPIFQPAGDFLSDQAPRVSGLEDAILLSGAALLVDSFMELPQSKGMYFSGPDLDYTGQPNETTGATPDDVINAIIDTYGQTAGAQYWAHAYDATVLLLNAIRAASYIDADGSLVIDRAGVREYLDTLEGYQGLIGQLSCDEFGDCGANKVTIIHHTDPDNVETSRENVVYSYTYTPS